VVRAGAPVLWGGWWWAPGDEAGPDGSLRRRGAGAALGAAVRDCVGWTFCAGDTGGGRAGVGLWVVSLGAREGAEAG
jgi:hypothetical protein